MRAILFVVFAALLIATAVTPAHAQAAGDYDRVIKEAVSEYSAHNWEEARALFRRAHELEPSARTWRGLGLTAFELRRYIDTIAELEAALADPRKPLTAKQRQEVDLLLARARQYIAVYRVDVKPSDTVILVDGKEVALTDGQLYLDPGPHTLVLRAPRHLETRQDLRVEAGDKEELSVELRVAEPDMPPAAEPGTSAVAATSPAPPPPTKPRPRLWTWVLGGVGVAGLGTGAALYLAALSKVNAYDEKGCDGDAAPASCSRIQSKGEGLYLGSLISLAGGGAFLAGSAVAFVLEGRAREASPSTALLIRPNGLALRQSF